MTGSAGGGRRSSPGRTGVESGERALSVIVRAMHDREVATKSIRAVCRNGYKDADRLLRRVMNSGTREQARHLFY